MILSALEWAHRYVDAGWHIVKCAHQGKNPVEAGWNTHSASPHDFSNGHNIGLLCNHDHVCIDLDVPEAVLLAEYCLPPTGMIGGRPKNPRSHWHYRSPGVGHIAYQVVVGKKDSELLSVRAEGKGQVLVCPSIHPDDGDTYEWYGDWPLEPAQVDREELETACRELAAATFIARCYPGDGARHAFILAIGGLLVKGGYDEEQAGYMVNAVCDVVRDEEKEDRLKAIETSYVGVRQKRPVSGRKGLIEQLGEHEGNLLCDRLTEWLRLRKPHARLERMLEEGPEVDIDLAFECLKQQQWGDAVLFGHLFKGHVLYDHSDRSWYYFVGHYWEKDQGRHAPHLIAEDVTGYYLKAAAYLQLEAAQYPTDAGTEKKEKDAPKTEREKLTEQAEAFLERARKIWHHSRNANILTDATSIPGMSLTGSEWDLHPLLLGCPNGVIELATGALRPGRPGDYIRTIVRAEYTGLDTPCPRFDRFLEEMFQDRQPEERKQIKRYLQRIVGYGITGYSDQAIFPVLWGAAGRNGKSTLVRALGYALGDIIDTLHPDALIRSRSRATGSAQPHLAALQGKRLLWASESDEGARFNISQVKNLTGNDRIKARDVHEKFKTFPPSHTILFLTNHKPHADATENPLWERLKLIPCNISFVSNPTKPHERNIDEDLEKDLQAEASGILAWCVRGYLMYQQGGINTPQCIRDATDSYRKEEDILEEYVQSGRVIEEAGAEIQASKLHHDYSEWWSLQSAVKPMSPKAFGTRASLRWEKDDKRVGVFYKGVRLTTAADIEKAKAQKETVVHVVDQRANPEVLQNLSRVANDDPQHDPPQPACTLSNSPGSGMSAYENSVVDHAVDHVSDNEKNSTEVLESPVDPPQPPHTTQGAIQRTMFEDEWEVLL